MSSAMRRLSIKTSSGTLSVCHWKGPKDAPVLHWAHANGFNARTYAPLLAPLATRFHIYATDARGHGHSTLPADPENHKNWYLYRDDLLAVRDWLGDRHPGQPVILAGHSMGGCVSALAAAAQPTAAHALFLVDPVIISWLGRMSMSVRNRLMGEQSNQMAAIARRRRAEWPSRQAVLKAYEGRGAFASWLPEFLKAYIDGGTLKTETGVRLACDPLWEAANFEAQAHNSTGAVRRLTQPFAVLMAEKGSTVFAPQPFFKNKNKFRVRSVPDTGHFLPMQVPDDVRREIHAFADHLGF